MFQFNADEHSDIWAVIKKYQTAEWQNRPIRIKSSRELCNKIGNCILTIVLLFRISARL